MTKKELIEDPASCLHKAADDEPVFLLRAHDILAPKVVRIWATLLRMEAQILSTKDQEAYRVSNQMLTWQELHGKKIPD